MKLLLAFFCVVALALVPVTASAAAQPSSGMPGCAMDGKHMPDMPPKHSKMDCCTPACQAPSSAALLPTRNAAGAVAGMRSPQLVSAPAKELASVPSSGLDPPPRA